MQIRRLAFAAMISALTAPAAAAENAAARPPSARAFERLIECRALTDPAARLACFDTESAALQQAAARRDVVVVDRAEVQRTRRSLFGITLPRLALFGEGEGDEAKVDEAIKELTTTISRASRRGDGRWVIVVADGAKWVQIDNRALPRDAKPGQPIRIRRAAMGSFFANVDGQIAIRMHREND